MFFQGNKEAGSQGEEDTHLYAKFSGVFEPPGAASGSNGYKTKACGRPAKEGELGHLEAVQEKGQHEDEKTFFGIDNVDDQKIYNHPGYEFWYLQERHIRFQCEHRGKKDHKEKKEEQFVQRVFHKG
jgi:hypothetical protein